MAARNYYVRFVPTGEVGLGKLVYTVSSTQKPTLIELRAKFPPIFKQKGTYTLVKESSSDAVVEK